MSEERTADVLARLARNADLARTVPLLRPDVLHAVIVHRGLHDCGELLALTTPAQLSALFDLDLWTAPRPGEEEEFDAARFCDWLDALVDAGPAIAAARLAAIDPALVVAGLSPNVAVFDAAVFSPDGEQSGADVVLNEGRKRGLHLDVGGFLVIGRTGEAWESIVQLLIELDERHPEAFRRLMRACCTLSSSGFERDGLDALLSGARQARFDLSVSREMRRERLGYVAPLEARAFLEAARRAPDVPGPTQHDSNHPSRALARRPKRDPSTIEPVLFLANVLVSGCTVQRRSFTLREALDAVAATCTLGRESWPSDRPLPSDPVPLFQEGWRRLHRDVSMTAAASLLDALGSIQSGDDDLRLELSALRRALQTQHRSGTPWRVGDRLDVLAQLDLPTWAALVALLDECPVMLANVHAPDGRPHTVDPSRFEFIAEAGHVAAVRQFLARVTDLLAR
jgi:hypothetical protein